MGQSGKDGEFVGRAEEMSALRELVDGSAHGRGPGVALITGEPGMGKTRLLFEATRHTAGLRVLRLTGFEPERQVPLGAAASLFRALAGIGPEGERLQALLATDAGPEGLESIRVFEATYQAVARACPVLVVIDDLQWLDELSRSLAHYLLRAALEERRELVLFCASRPAPGAADFMHSISELFEEPQRCTRLTLAPLGRHDGIRLSRAVNPSLDQESAVDLWSRGGGSPFWIRMAARRDSESGDASHPVTELLRTLSPDAATCLAGLVVAARPFLLPEISDLLEWPDSRTQSALTELVNRGLVTAQAAWFGVAHDLVRETASAQLPKQEVIRVHGRLADQLRRKANGDVQMLMEALDHAEAAGVTTVELGLAIARSPQRRLLGQAGLARLDTIAGSPTPEVDANMALLKELAYIAEEIGDHESAAERFAKLSESSATAAERAEAAVKAARHALEVGGSIDAATAVNRARKNALGNEWVEVAADALEFRRLVWLEHDSAGARPFRERAVRAARRLIEEAGSVEVLSAPDRQAYLEALDAERVARLMDDDITGMLDVVDEMVDASRGMGERHIDMRIFSCMGLRFLNRWQEVETRLRQGIAEASQQVYPGMVAYAMYELAITVHHLGRVAEARDLYAEARRLGTRIDRAFEVADTWLSGFGPFIEASTGDWRESLASLIELADQESNPHCRLMIRQQAATLAGRFAPGESRDLVVGLLESADEDAVAADCVRCLRELRVISAELYARVGETQRARELLTEWDKQHPAPHPRAAFMRLRSGAVLGAATGDDAAAQLLRDAIACAAGYGLRLDELWGLIDLGSVLAATDTDAAVDAWTDASRLAGELGAMSEAALVKQHLRRLGVRRASPSRRRVDLSSPLAALSRRELEVARLAATGARNVDIAGSLFISTKTVEQHLSRVFAQLGVRNRTELGARYREQLTAELTDSNK